MAENIYRYVVLLGSLAPPGCLPLCREHLFTTTCIQYCSNLHMTLTFYGSSSPIHSMILMTGWWDFVNLAFICQEKAGIEFTENNTSKTMDWHAGILWWDRSLSNLWCHDRLQHCRHSHYWISPIPHPGQMPTPLMSQDSYAGCVYLVEYGTSILAQEVYGRTLMYNSSLPHRIPIVEYRWY